MKYTLNLEAGAAPRQIAAATHLLASLAKDAPEEDGAIAFFVPAFQTMFVNGDDSNESVAFWLRDEDTSMSFSEEFWFGPTTTKGTPVLSTESPTEPTFWLPEGA